MSELVNGSSKIQAGTVDGEIEFLDYIVKRGYGPESAIRPWKSAVRQVHTTVEATEEVGAINVREIDLDDYLERFATKARGNYKVESIQAYRNRFARAHEAYLTFLDTGKPPTFRGRAPRGRAADAPPASSPSASAPVEVSAPRATSGEPMIEYPFPLRSGQIARLTLPVRFAKDDAERMATFIRTLVFEAPRELGPGAADGESE